MIPELRAERVHMKEDCAAAPEDRIPWTTDEGKQAIKLNSPDTITAEYQKCTVDFFLIITGNETVNSNILILLYCQNHFIGSVAIERITLV